MSTGKKTSVSARGGQVEAIPHTSAHSIRFAFIYEHCRAIP
jgi:hypothetical protein